MTQIITVNEKQYKVLDNTYFHLDTPDNLCALICELISKEIKIKVFLGDPKTGENWNEEHDTIGTIGKSTGTIKRPLLVPIRAYGGSALMTDRVVAIYTLKDRHNTRKCLYKCDKFKFSNIVIQEGNLPEYPYSVYIDGELYSNHKTERSAMLLLSKLS